MLAFLGCPCFPDLPTEESDKETETEGPRFIASMIHSLLSNIKSGSLNRIHKASHSSVWRPAGVRLYSRKPRSHLIAEDVLQACLIYRWLLIPSLMVASCDITRDTNRGLGCSQNHIYFKSVITSF